MVDETVNENVETIETSPEEVNEEVVAAPEENIQSDEQSVSESKQETYQQKNFRELREENERQAKLREQAERERDEAIAYAKQFQKEYDQYNEPIVDDDYNDISLSIGEDELAEGKHIKALMNKVEKLENKLYQTQQNSYAISAETMVRNKYPDFDSVVTKESLQALRREHPELADSLQSNPDIYKQAVAAYKLIQKFGKAPTYNNSKDVIKTNSIKPRPLSSISSQQGNTPLSHANTFSQSLTEEMKEQYRRKMEEAINS